MLGRSTQDILIDCVEREEEIYLEALKDPFVRNKNVTLYRNCVFKHLDRFPTSQYDGIWLDLCGQMSVGILQDIARIVMSNKISDNSYLAVTFMANRERHDILRLFQTDNHEIIRTKMFPEFIVNAAILANRTCKLVECHKYKNDNFKAAPMRLYVFKIQGI